MYNQYFVVKTVQREMTEATLESQKEPYFKPSTG